MQILRMLNKILGSVFLSLFFIPLIALAALSRVFNFIDYLYQGEIARAALSLMAAPFTALGTVIIGFSILLETGWERGLSGLITTLPMRTIHFFRKQLPFGTQENESVSRFFRGTTATPGLDVLVTPGLFGKLTLKLLSLCASMESFNAYEESLKSPHNDVSIYFTEKNMGILQEMYATHEKEHSEEIQSEIKCYLEARLCESNSKIEIITSLPLDDDTRTGKLQSAMDELETIRSAQRCIDSFTNNNNFARDLNYRFHCAPKTVLNYVWLAINLECPDENQQLTLKDKLTWTLLLIQRGYNIVNGGGGSDLTECPGGAIGLLVRVICNEQEKMPNSKYEAADPNPTNLSLALKSALDRPFVSSYQFTMKMTREMYKINPNAYKKEQKEAISKAWKATYSPLIEAGVLQESSLDELINAGVEVWEPPSVQEEARVSPSF